MSRTQDLGRFVADVSFERLPAGRAKIAPDLLVERLKHLEELSARELTVV
jgi:hypothetical protein